MRGTVRAHSLLVLLVLPLPALTAPALLCCAELSPVPEHEGCAAGPGEPPASHTRCSPTGSCAGRAEPSAMACCEGDALARARLAAPRPLPASATAATPTPATGLARRTASVLEERSRVTGTQPLYSLHHALLI